MLYRISYPPIFLQHFQKASALWLLKLVRKRRGGRQTLELFNELSSTSAKKAERRQNDAMEFDPRYIITVTYTNGQSDQICMIGSDGEWFRWYDIDKYVITNNNDTILKLIEEYLE
jgi:hypothetical protein